MRWITLIVIGCVIWNVYTGFRLPRESLWRILLVGAGGMILVAWFAEVMFFRDVGQSSRRRLLWLALIALLIGVLATTVLSWYQSREPESPINLDIMAGQLDAGGISATHVSQKDYSIIRASPFQHCPSPSGGGLFLLKEEW